MANPIKLENVKINSGTIASYLINGGIQLTEVPMRGYVNSKSRIQNYNIEVAFCNPRPDKTYDRETESYVDATDRWKVDLIYFYDKDSAFSKRGQCDIRENIQVTADGVVNIDKKKFHIGNYRTIIKKQNIQIIKG
jgi:hypothetical protein